MAILIDKIRIFGFRGLSNIEVSLEKTTVFTGMNNSGKTSFLKALQILFGTNQFISKDDFYISEVEICDRIVVDAKVIPIDAEGIQVNRFDENWETLFTDDRIRNDNQGNQFIPLRTVVTFDKIKNTFKSNQYIQQEWVDFLNEQGKFWHETNVGTDKNFHFDEIPFFYMDAQRDIIEDMKVRNSYLGTVTK